MMDNQTIQVRLFAPARWGYRDITGMGESTAWSERYDTAADAWCAALKRHGIDLAAKVDKAKIEKVASQELGAPVNVTLGGAGTHTLELHLHRE